MPQEELPLDLERVVADLAVRHAGPGAEVVDAGVDVRVPGRARRGALVLHDAVPQAGHRAALGAVDLHGQEVVAADAHGPGRVEGDDDAVGQLEGGVGGVIRGAGVGFAALVDARFHVRGAQAGDGLDLAEEVVDHVAPVAEHVADDAAVVFFAVVPARPLRRDGGRAVEDPVAELPPDGEDLPEEPAGDERAEFDQARQPELVLYHAVLDAGFLRGLVQLVGTVRGDGGGFFAVDVLSRRYGFLDRIGAPARDLGVEIHGVVRICKRSVEVRGGALDAVVFGELLQFAWIPPDKNGVGHDDVSFGCLGPSFGTNGTY